MKKSTTSLKNNKSNSRKSLRKSLRRRGQGRTEQGYNYLREKIIDNLWLGKEILDLNDNINGAIEEGKEWLWKIPGMNIIKEYSGFGRLYEMMEDTKEIAGTIANCGLIFLETCHGINRAFNSKKHEDVLTLQGEKLLQKFSNQSKKEEIEIYDGLVIAHNETIDLPFLDSKTKEIKETIDRITNTVTNKPIEIIETLKKRASELLKKYQEEAAELLEVVLGETGEFRRRMRAYIRGLQTAIKRMLGIEKTFTEKSKFINPKSAIVPIAGGIATIGAAGKIIGVIASWFITNIFANFFSIPAQLIGALAHCITSVVLKSLGSAGADAYRYLAAAVLRTFQQLIPHIAGVTGMLGTAWQFLLACAPIIIGIAVIIIVAVKQNKDLTFSHLYLLAEHSEYPAFAYASIENPDDAPTEFSAMKDDLQAISTVQYSHIYGIGVELENNTPQVKGGYDLNHKPVKISRTNADSIFQSFIDKHKLRIPIGQWKLL